MSANQDAAKEVYTPLLRSRTVSTTDSAPTLASDGQPVQGFNYVLVTAKLTSITEFQFKLWMYDGASWIVREDTSTLAAEEFNPAADFGQSYLCKGWVRYAVQFTTLTGGGSIVSAENLTI